MNYYTPKTEELLEAIIYKETIYSKTEEGNIIEFKGLLNIEDTLHTFIEINNVEIRYDENNEPVYYYFVNPELYLLKYLDKQDIEECGFMNYETQWSEPSVYYFIQKSETINKIKIKQCSLKLNMVQGELLKDSFVCIIKDNQYLFQGIIKNKSELKRLLKQLNIN